MALNDYSCVSTSNTPAINGFNPDFPGKPCHSNFNLLSQQTDIFFIVAFTIECVLKVVAMGFFIGR